MRVLLKAPVNPYSGYGQDGIGLCLALLNAGLDVSLDPTYVSPPLPQPVAGLLTRRLQAPFDLLIHHVDPAQLGLAPEARRAATTTVAWTMWEYTSLANCKRRSSLRRRLRDYDLVLGYDTVTTDALRPYTARRAVLQGGYWPELWPAVSRDWTSARFGFCMVGALHQRKDPFVAIQAFKELKDEHPDEFAPAELHLKTNTPGLHSALQEWVPKLRVHYSVWPDDVLRDFYAAQHVLLAPSRGEGKNMPALEMLSTGGTVIATNWGGHQQWLSSQYAYPLDCELVAEAPTIPDCKSARASKDHLKALMLHTFRNRDECAHKGALAARLIPQMCSWEAVVQRLFTKLGEHIAEHGQHLVHEARTAAERARRARTPEPAHA